MQSKDFNNACQRSLSQRMKKHPPASPLSMNLRSARSRLFPRWIDVRVIDSNEHAGLYSTCLALCLRHGRTVSLSCSCLMSSWIEWHLPWARAFCSLECNLSDDSSEEIVAMSRIFIFQNKTSVIETSISDHSKNLRRRVWKGEREREQDNGKHKNKFSSTADESRHRHRWRERERENRPRNKNMHRWTLQNQGRKENH